MNIEKNIQIDTQMDTDYASVKDFGAVGDGRTNDTAAIRRAQKSSNTLFFPEGVYLVDSIQYKTQRLYGRNATLKSSSRSNLFVVNSDDVEISIDNLEFEGFNSILKMRNDKTRDDYDYSYSLSLSHITCSNFRTLIFSSSSPSGTKGVKSLIIEHSKFENFRGTILDLYSIRNNNIRINNNYVNNAKSGFKMGYRFQSRNASGLTGNVHIESNTIKNLNDVSDANAISVIGIDNCIIRGNYIENVYSDDNTDAEGIYTKSMNTIIESNILHNAGGNQGAIIQKGLGFGNFINQISNNKIYFTDTFINRRRLNPIGITTVAGGASIQSNLIVNCRQGISVSTKSDSSMFINANIIRSQKGQNTFGILVENSFKNIIIKNNLLEDFSAVNNAFGVYFSRNISGIESAIIEGNTFRNITGKLSAGIKNAGKSLIDLLSISNNQFINSAYCIDHDNNLYTTYLFKDNIGKSVRSHEQGNFTAVSKLHKDNIINNVYLGNLKEDIVETFEVKVYSSHVIASRDPELPNNGRYRLTGNRSIFHKL